MLNEERFKECNIRIGPRAKLVNWINNQKQPGVGNIPDVVSLKREFEQVVIQQVGSLRSEVKRVRYVAESWLSSPGILTETEKRRGMRGRFQDQPDASEIEDVWQEYFIEECNELKGTRGTKLIVADTHLTPLLNTRKPDFVFIQKGRPLDPLNVLAVGEIRKRTSKTKCRSSENLQYADSEPPTGWKYLMTIMESSPNELGWVEPSLNFDGVTVTLNRSISAGRTSIVYEGTNSDKELVVVKIAKRNEYLSCFKQERDALTRLSELNSPHIPKLLLSNANTLVMTPLCTKVKNLRKEDIERIIETLKVVHSQYHIVHRDLRKYNFLRDDNGNILIADWGYSVIEGDNMPFAGALECMPDDVLESLDNNEAINYNPRMDLICLVRSLYLMFHNPVMERFSFDKVLENENFKERLQEIKTFWSSHGNSSEWWATIYQEANEANYDNLLRNLINFF
ncbi:unnamed protein product [Rhizophagus irregularis]|nr:unnamed protein product [Rhizophagus irregularis]CAB5390585.1 unnamed protein product [Rhizophagus irregularis]